MNPFCTRTRILAPRRTGNCHPSKPRGLHDQNQYIFSYAVPFARDIQVHRRNKIYKHHSHGGDLTLIESKTCLLNAHLIMPHDFKHSTGRAQLLLLEKCMKGAQPL